MNQDSTIEYQLRQLENKKQLFISLDPDNSTCFAVNFRSTISAFLSKPHISIETILAGRHNTVVSSIKFNSPATKQPPPWVPTAVVSYIDKPGQEETMELKAPLSLRWHVQIGHLQCTWDLLYTPPSLHLKPDDSSVTLAMFTWGEHGNRTQNGQNVGQLRVFEEGKEFQIQILSTVSAVVAHWKSVGKFLIG